MLGPDLGQQGLGVDHVGGGPYLFLITVLVDAEVFLTLSYGRLGHGYPLLCHPGVVDGGPVFEGEIRFQLAEPLFGSRAVFDRLAVTGGRGEAVEEVDLEADRRGVDSLLLHLVVLDVVEPGLGEEFGIEAGPGFLYRRFIGVEELPLRLDLCPPGDYLFRGLVQYRPGRF